jgi:dienelactone hydrolase
MPDVVADVEAVLDHLAANAEALRVDGTRVALVAVSMGVPFGLRVAFDRRAALRCVVALYGPMDLNGLPGRDGVAPEVLAEFSPLHHLRAGHELPPLLVARAGGDQPVLNASIDAFVAEALSRNLELDLLNHPAGPHAFDVRDRSPRSRAVIAATLRFLRTHLERA